MAARRRIQPALNAPATLIVCDGPAGFCRESADGYGVGMPGAERSDGELNLGSVGRALWRNKRSIIGPTLIMAAAALVAVSPMTARHKAEARVLVEGRENIFLRPEAEKAMTERSPVDAETVTSQVQLVLSRDLALDIIKELNLTEQPEFNAALREF